MEQKSKEELELLRKQNSEKRFLEDEDFRENILKRMREMSSEELVIKLFD